MAAPRDDVSSPGGARRPRRRRRRDGTIGVVEAVTQHNCYPCAHQVSPCASSWACRVTECSRLITFSSSNSTVSSAAESTGTVMTNALRECCGERMFKLTGPFGAIVTTMDEAVFRAYIAEFNAANFDALARYYADNVVFSFNGGLTLTGRDAIVGFYRPFRAAVDETVDIGDSWSWTTSTSRLRWPPSSAPARTTRTSPAARSRPADTRAHHQLRPLRHRPRRPRSRDLGRPLRRLRKSTTETGVNPPVRSARVAPAWPAREGRVSARACFWQAERPEARHRRAQPPVLSPGRGHAGSLGHHCPLVLL